MDIQTKDGITLRGIPEGTPEEAIKERINKIRAEKGMSKDAFAQVKAEGNVVKPPPMMVPSGEKELPSWTSPQGIAGNPVTRFALGAAAPVLGAVQLGANVVGQGEGINQHLAQLEALKRRGMQEQGAGNFDLMGTTGQAMSPVFLAAGGRLPPTTTGGQRVMQGATFGAGAGALEPVTNGGENYGAIKTGQVVGGGMVGGLVPGAWEGAKTVGRGVRNIVQPYMGQWGADRGAGRLANTMAGDRRQAVIDALENPEFTVPGAAPTAGQAAVPANSAEFSALSKIAAERNPSMYYGPKGIEGIQNKARVDALRTIAKTPDDLASARTLRDANAAENYGPIMDKMVSPESQTDVMRNAIAAKARSKAEALRDQGRFLTEASQQENLAHGGIGPAGGRSPTAVPVPGMPRIPGRYTENIERVAPAKAAAADAASIAGQRRAEEEYLTRLMDTLNDSVGLENRSLSKFLNRPSVKAALQDAERGAAESGRYFPSKQGDQFSVANMQRIKESLDDAVRDPASFGIKATEAKEIENTRQAFVDWLSNKVPEWKKARLAYREDSIPIDQMEAGQFLVDKTTSALRGEGKLKPEVYANILREGDSLLKRATGRDRPMASYMNPQQFETMRGVSRDLGRNADFDALAQKGAQAANRAISGHIKELPPTGMFSPAISVTRGLYNRATGGATDKILDDLALRMANPQEMARVMKAATPFQRQALVDALMRYQAPGVVGAINEGGK